MKKINLHFIPSQVLFFYGLDDYIKWVKANLNDYAQFLPNSSGLTVSTNGDKGHIVLIYISDEKIDKNKKIGLIAHEINHATDFIYKEHGFDCTELKSYLMQYVLTEILNFLEKIEQL